MYNLLVAKQDLDCSKDCHLVLVGKCDQGIQVVHLTLNQAIDRPEDGVEVR